MICTKCGEDKPDTNFSMRGKLRRKQCKKCHQGAITYANNKARQAKREYILEDKKKGCSVCGEKRPYCLDYHHVNAEDKTITISKLLVQGSGVKRLIKEIDKCILVCANCHREIHYLEEHEGSVTQSG